MKNLKKIRYCNECPFMRSEVNKKLYPDFDWQKQPTYEETLILPPYIVWCSLPKLLAKDFNKVEAIKLPYSKTIMPPDNCPLKKDSILVEIEK